VFNDPHLVMEQDREIDGEERWQTTGRIGSRTVVLVAHTVVDEDEEVICRIISARQATPHERRRYEANTN
jgi:uncharacterized DUF497 family protein